MRPNKDPGAQFTKYRTIYHIIILSFHVRSTYDSDLQRAEISVRNIVSQFTNTISHDFTILQMYCS